MMINRKPGDWNCGSCGHHNFSRRETCQRCGQPRSMSGATGCGPEFLRGDWLCWSCGTHNYASRPNCFKCAAGKDMASGVGVDGTRGITGWKSGDWLCSRSGCNEHNFASRSECFRCNKPKAYGSEYWNEES